MTTDLEDSAPARMADKPVSDAVGPAPKPFPWPIFLALLAPVVVGAGLAWEWHEKNVGFVLRAGWLSLCGLLPGFSVMTAIGSLAQLRRRPVLSLLAICLAAATFIACAWLAQHIADSPWLD
ncbi:MAG: hypothetical protein HY360_17690 [Verrucomicrobia bacterium]|nr:hypothetical protein [Verrucomicrobiota bacterium]